MRLRFAVVAVVMVGATTMPAWPTAAAQIPLTCTATGTLTRGFGLLPGSVSLVGTCTQPDGSQVLVQVGGTGGMTPIAGVPDAASLCSYLAFGVSRSLTGANTFEAANQLWHNGGMYPPVVPVVGLGVLPGASVLTINSRPNTSTIVGIGLLRMLDQTIPVPCPQSMRVEATWVEVS
jgi:hypothetical protein